MDPPNDTDPDKTIDRVKDNDQTFHDLNWNNIRVCRFSPLLAGFS